MATKQARRNALIQRGCELEKQIKALQSEQDEIKRELYVHFDKPNEKLVCKHGVAERRCSQTFAVDAKDVPEITRLVGRDYVDEYLVQKTSYGVTAKTRAVLTSMDDVMAASLRSLVMIRKSESIRFVPAG